MATQKPFTRFDGIAAVLMRDNIDTDVIIPSREITSPSREGYGVKLFAPWRYEAPGPQDNDRVERADFVLNRAPWRMATILVTGPNFGCGSSREMAVWALAQFGFRAIVAPSFGSIFKSNCIRNGVLPLELALPQVVSLAALCESAATPLHINLPGSLLCAPDGSEYRFSLDDDDREMLMTGMDAIDRTWQLRDAIEAFEAADRLRRPWIWAQSLR